MQPADRLKNLPPYLFAQLGRHIAQLRAQGVDVIRLDIGNPDLPPAEHIVEALYHSAKNPGHHGYPGFSGIPTLREAIADYYARRFGVELDPESEVVPLIGSKEGIVNIALATIDPGDLALVPDPGYPPYRMGVFLAGGEAHYIPLLAENGFRPDLSAIPAEVAERAELMWLCYPNNPTGAVTGLDFFAEVVDFAREYDLLICHDNPYCDITYDGYIAPSILQMDGAKDVAVEFNSLSKVYNMAGWRVGMAVGNAGALQALAQVKSNIDSGIFRPLQDAAVAALTGDQSWLPERNSLYQERRDIVLETLAELGIEAQKPLATLYIWAKAPEGYTSQGFAARLLEEKGVSFAPGSFYGKHGEGYLRISISAPTERVKEGMDRLRGFEF